MQDSKNTQQISDLIAMYFKQPNSNLEQDASLAQKVEKLFADEHLLTDVQMLIEIRRHNGTFISLAFLLQHEELRKLNMDKNKLSNLLRMHSKLLELNKDGSMVRRVEPVTDIALEPLVARSLLVENLPELLASSQTLTSMFSHFGKVAAVNVYHPQQVKKGQGTSTGTSGTSQSSQSPYAVVLFELQSDADKTIQMMNEEHEKRFGLNVCKMPFPKLPILNNPGKKFVRMNLFVNKEGYVSVELIMVQGQGTLPVPQSGIISPRQPALQGNPFVALPHVQNVPTVQNVPSMVNQSVKRTDQARVSSMTHEAAPFVPRGDGQFGSFHTPTPPFTPRENRPVLGQRSLGSLTSQYPQNNNSNDLLLQQLQNSVNNLTSVNNNSNNLFQQPQNNNIFQQPQNNNMFQQPQNSLLQQQLQQSININNNLFQQPQNTGNTALQNFSMEELKNLETLLRGNIAGILARQQQQPGGQNNTNIQQQLLMHQQSQLSSRLSSMPATTSIVPELQPLAPQFTPRSTSLSPTNAPWSPKAVPQVPNVPQQQWQQQQPVPQQQSVPQVLQQPQQVPQVLQQPQQQFVPQLQQVSQGANTNVSQSQQLQSPQAQRSVSYNPQHTTLQLNTVRRSTSVGSSGSSASTFNGPVPPLSPASTLPISENKPYLFNRNQNSQTERKDALKEMLSAWETADKGKGDNAAGGAGGDKGDRGDRSNTPVEPSPWMTVPTGFQSVQTRNQRQQNKKDYAAWAAATPEMRAAAQARNSPPQDDRRSSSVDVNTWIPRVQTQSQSRSPRQSNQPHSRSLNLSPRITPSVRPSFAARGDSAAESQVRIAKTPDGTRGFAAGRGKGQVTTN